MDIFFEGLNDQYSVYPLMVFKVFQKLFTSLYNYYFLFASLKLLPNFENAYGNPPQNFLLCDWSMFSSADLSLDVRKMCEN